MQDHVQVEEQEEFFLLQRPALAKKYLEQSSWNKEVLVHIQDHVQAED